MLNLIKKLVVTGALVALVFTSFVSPLKAQTVPAGSVLILYDGSGDFGWIGGMHARHLANLLGHFDQPYVIAPVENYTAGTMDGAKATFYFGTVYDNPLPAAFQADTLTTTNTLCWFRYNLWQVANTNFTAKFGFQFNWLDWSGYSNIVYKGESLVKNQLDPELGYVTVLNTNLASVPATAVMRDANGNVTASIPYVTHSSNFWYVADLPFEYMSEEDRYLVFADLLHDILGINHAESHRALVRLEDVAPTMYTPAVLQQTANLLKSNNVPFAIAFVPFYNDPLGTYNGGVPVSHHINDTTDTNSMAFNAAIRYSMARGAQLVIHGYSHQYSSVANPYDGCTGDDFEFWRETFNTATTNDLFDLDLYSPIPEDSAAYALNRINTAKGELASAGFSAIGWESPHYASSATDYQVFATNFPLVMHRVLYFDDLGHISGQMFPYIINKDIYGQRIVPENLGNIEPDPWQNYPARSAADIVRAAKKNLVVRDGFASAYFHPFFDLTNLTAIVTGVKALGYTYVQVSGSEAPSLTTQPTSRTNNAGTTASFTSAAVGAAPLTYQWRLAGVALAGKTNATLSVANVQAANAGIYDVVVSNPYGSVTSYGANLTVSAGIVAITAQPASRTNNAGSTASFSVTVNGSAPYNYFWYFNGTNLANSLNSTANSSTLSIANAQQANAGNYQVIVTNAFGSVTSSVAALKIVDIAPVITSQPASRTNNAGTTAAFSVTVTGTTPRTFQWRFNGTNILGATNTSLSVANVQPANAGNYSVVISNAIGGVTSANALLTVVVIAPGITSQPASRTNAVGTTATFTVSLSGSTPRTFQWRLNGVNVAGGTNQTLTLSNVQLAQAGNYSIVVSNSAGSVTSSNAVLTVGTAPAIATQPTSRTVTRGSSTTFSVVATGTGPLAYQWAFKGTNIAGATLTSLALTNVQTNQAGAYSVRVTSPFGTVNSANATLTVN